MHAYFRNHQLYLAEKSAWLERQTQKSSKRALMKIESLKLISQAGEDTDQIRLVEKLVKDSLLTLVPAQSILHREGFYKFNLRN
jgi:peptidyl-tRNA hydrolase